ncbi:unnamed protein product [Paramecium pentaurelia]|uniref:FHA domain-containing protein n=1 Tax=Paramecium pentaurelia TaxID=43138 RepID=A0A8S1VSC1_9CILI|nr:unnamed protein product [Paramecium pentaurelia]
MQKKYAQANEFENSQILYSGEYVLKKTKAYERNANEIFNVNTYRIIYKKKNEPAIKSFLPNPSCIRAQISSALNKAQQFFPQLQCDIELDDNNTCFTIGRLEKEVVNLDNDIQAIVIFNKVECLNEEMMNSIHLLVDFSNLIRVMNLEEHCRQFIHQFESSKRSQMISSKTMELIAQSIYQNKQKIKIQDISQMRGYPTCIQITKNCENQILEDGNIFRVGYQPQLTVRKIYNKFENFFQRYSTRSDVDDMIFEALQALQSRVQFSGVDDSVSELFMHVQERSINKSEYMQRLEDENLMIQTKLYAALDKNCILLQTQKDENPIEHFLLVADQKNTFHFGRMEFSDIAFQSTQVSRNHGTIQFMPSNNKWIIMDGQKNFDQWKTSTFGVWLQMNPKTFYFLDPEQIVKVGSTNIKLIPNNCQINNQDTDDSIQLNNFINQREEEIEELTKTLLDQ